MKTKTGIAVQRVDFSDPQGGKGSCDRKAATVKAHVRRFINEGHDVLNANDFMNAMMSSGGIPDVRVVIVDAASTKRNTQVQVKWAGINPLNNFFGSLIMSSLFGELMMLAPGRRCKVSKNYSVNKGKLNK